METRFSINFISLVLSFSNLSVDPNTPLLYIRPHYHVLSLKLQKRGLMSDQKKSPFFHGFLLKFIYTNI